MIAKWLVSAHGGFLLMESTDETLASKYSPRSVTKRMKLAEVRAFLWLERAHDYLDDLDVQDGNGGRTGTFAIATLVWRDNGYRSRGRACHCNCALRRGDGASRCHGWRWGGGGGGGGVTVPLPHGLVMTPVGKPETSAPPEHRNCGKSASFTPATCGSW
jgi:hypothetical protein